MTAAPPTTPRRWVGPAVLAALAYLPALASSPGRMPADTKLYLYFDPGGLLGRAASTFEVEQFAGWVPHQQIAYLWPAGPWFWLFDVLGVPDWVAHRLWIGTILFAAGAGVRWCARLLGLREAGAMCAALVYQLSPYILAYVSRTSLLLLPWAALGWIVGLTIRAGAAAETPRAVSWRARLTAWRDPALIALVVATIGAVNATAVALIIPAPVLWLVHAAWQRSLTWRTATVTALRIGALSLLVSLWWIGMLVVQARSGAPVLAFSETLADVSRNSTGSEVLRMLGYWLFYQRDPVGPTTTASLPYLVSTRAIVVSYAIILVGFVGLTVVSWAQRRYAAMLVLTGLVLAVGVHPIDQPSPLMTLFTDGSGLALALRSSTRAVPVLLFGTALGAGAAVSALPMRWRHRGHSLATPARVGAVAVAVLAVLNLPAMTGRELVDPAIDRVEDPPAVWTDAAARIDDATDGTRVLQLPGAEFGSFRWGHTNDQPLVGLGSTPLVTRDLLPLGSAAAMDLLYALDDRFQEGTIETEAVAPLARLLGADTILLTNDMAYERYRTPRPELVDAALTAPGVTGLGTVERLGDPAVNVAEVPMIDPTSIADERVGRPITPLTLIDVEDEQPVIRAKARTVVLAGSGDGVVDAAASGLLDGSEAILYSASLPDADLDGAIADADAVIVTDSNRDRAHHWRGSQDVHGHTEPGGPGDDVLVATDADQRLEVFEGEDAQRQTVAVQSGPVTAIASAYGEPFAYRPEDRAVHAIDGDSSTAWTVADHGDPIGERLRLTLSDAGAAERAGRDTVTLRQVAPAPGGRAITSVRLTIDDARELDVALDETSFAGQTVRDPAFTDMTTLEIEITDVSDGDPALAASRAGVGFAEVGLGVSPTTEVIRVPVDAVTDGPLAIVLTRLRVDPSDPWRSDPEPTLVRSVRTTTPRRFAADVTLRLDPRAPDQAIAALLGGESGPMTPAIADRRLDGAVSSGGAAVADGDPDTAWITPFDAGVGATVTLTTTGPLRSFELTQAAGPFSPIDGLTISDGDRTVDVEVPSADEEGRSTIVLPEELDAGTVSITVASIAPVTTVDRRYGDTLTLPTAIAEVSSPVMSPVSLDREATVQRECVEGLLSVDGRPVRLSFTTTAGDLLEGNAVDAEVCDGEPIEIDPGEHLVEARGSDALTVDRVVLRDGIDHVTGSRDAPIPVTVGRDDPRRRSVTVAPCPEGCWLVLGEGFNDAWSASTAAGDLGPPTLIDGGFNGWWLPPTTAETTVELRWTAQGPVTWGLTIGIVTALLSVLIVIAARATPSPALPAPEPPDRRARRSRRRSIVAAATLVVLATALISPVWGLIATVPAALTIATDRMRWPAVRLLELVGVASAVAVAVGVLVVERAEQPLPDAGWTVDFQHLNGLAVFATLALAVGAMFAPDAEVVP